MNKDVSDLSKEELSNLVSQVSKPTAIIVIAGMCGAAEGLYYWLLYTLNQALPDVTQFIWITFLVVILYIDRQINKIEIRQKALIELLRKSNVIES